MAKRERDQRSPRGDRTRLVGLHFRNANPEATADLVVRLALGGRGMKMPFEGSVRSGPNVWFIRDRGLRWENADG